MNFDLSEEQALFKATVERFVAPVDGDRRRALRADAQGYDRARWRELAELGLIALAVPDAAGGMGGSLTDLAVIAEALGRGSAPDPWLENAVLPAMLLAVGGETRSLPAVMDGSAIAAFAFAERDQRYSLMPRATRAVRKGDGFILTGEKTFVPGGGLADVLLVSADLDGAPACFCVPAAAAGVDRRVYTAVDGSHAAEVQLRAVAVDAAARLSMAPAAFADVIATIRLLAAAEMVGLGQSLLDQTLDYVKQREQFGVPIGSFQALQHRLVDCYAMLEQARSMLWRVVLADRGDAAAWARAASGAKAYIAENALHIGREAVQLHGGMGITDELAIGHALKRLLLLERLFGDRAADLTHYAEAA